MTARGAIRVLLAAVALGAVSCGDATPARDLTATASGTDARASVAAPTGPTLVAAGDIACEPGQPRTAVTCHHADTAGIVGRLDPDVVAPLGDLQYPWGSLEDFRGSYAPTWGRYRGRSRPAVGNHEYGTRGAAGYFAYFGRRAGSPARGWYSYELGRWHVVVLNTNCDVVSCAAGGRQQRWLRADLARHPTRCTLAYAHHPRFSSGTHGSEELLAPLWETLQEGGTELMLSGHDHHYERFGPQDAAGEADPARGIVQFVVGSGGASHYPTPIVQPSSRVRATTFGVLELTLGARSYTWRFVGEAGEEFRDAGRAACR